MGCRAVELAYELAVNRIAWLERAPLCEVEALRRAWAPAILLLGMLYDRPMSVRAARGCLQLGLCALGPCAETPLGILSCWRVMVVMVLVEMHVWHLATTVVELGTQGMRGMAVCAIPVT